MSDKFQFPQANSESRTVNTGENTLNGVIPPDVAERNTQILNRVSPLEEEIKEMKIVTEEIEQILRSKGLSVKDIIPYINTQSSVNISKENEEFELSKQNENIKITPLEIARYFNTLTEASRTKQGYLAFRDNPVKFTNTISDIINAVSNNRSDGFYTYTPRYELINYFLKQMNKPNTKE